VQAWHKDLSAGTLVLPAINPVQAKDMDLLALVSLVRLKADPDKLKKKVHRLIGHLRKQILKDIKNVLKPTKVVETIVSVTAEGLRAGDDIEKTGADWFSTQVLAVLEHALADAAENEGLKIPHLAEALLESFRPLCDHLGFQLID
jgi:hypothetical protein